MLPIKSIPGFVTMCLCALALAGCNGSAKPEIKMLETKPVVDSTIVPKKETVFVPNTVLPFGCNILISYKFPHKWIDTSMIEPGSKPSHYSKKLSEVDTCISGLGYHVNSISRPYDTLHSEFIKIPMKNYLYFDSVPMGISNCKYQLPDIGPYHSFYVSNPLFLSHVRELAGASGNLVLYDTVAKKSKVLNVYFMLNGEVSVAQRFFYIDKNGDIEIYDEENDETDFSFTHSYSIHITPSGEINIVKASRP
jgi:hypothetical protein